MILHEMPEDGLYFQCTLLAYLKGNWRLALQCFMWASSCELEWWVNMWLSCLTALISTMSFIGAIGVSMINKMMFTLISKPYESFIKMATFDKKTAKYESYSCIYLQ